MKNLKTGKKIQEIAHSWGYLWFLYLNVMFCCWLLLRGAVADPAYLSSPALHMLGIATIVFALINIAIYLTVKRNPFPQAFPLAVLAFGLLWAVMFYLMITYYNTPAVALSLMIIILLPATIAFYISGRLLMLFCAPVVLSLLYSELTSVNKFNLLQVTGTFIILLVVVSARYILLEWYNRTQRSEYEKNLLIKKLTKLAHYDSLTGLFNKGSMATYFTRCIASLEGTSDRLFMIVLDIDFFKQYNDLYGHVIGDECLSKTAQCIERSLRKSSDAAFRFGGEEFIILTRGAEISQAVSIAGRIRNAIAEARIPHGDSDISPWLTASFGIAEWSPGLSLDTLLAQADKELYKAKRAGRNRISFISSRSSRIPQLP